jgi:hypothetical protein
MTPPRPEEAAREEIDTALTEAGWVVQDMGDLNLAAGIGVAVREFYMAKGYGVSVRAHPLGEAVRISHAGRSRRSSGGQARLARTA